MRLAQLGKPDPPPDPPMGPQAAMVFNWLLVHARSVGAAAIYLKGHEYSSDGEPESSRFSFAFQGNRTCTADLVIPSFVWLSHVHRALVQLEEGHGYFHNITPGRAAEYLSRDDIFDLLKSVTSL